MICTNKNMFPGKKEYLIQLFQLKDKSIVFTSLVQFCTHPREKANHIKKGTKCRKKLFKNTLK
jgi:hypothetical protein